MASFRQNLRNSRALRLLSSTLPSIFAGIMLFSSVLHAQVATTSYPASHPEKIRQDALQKVRNTVDSILTQYCKESCQLIDAKVILEETVPETVDLGFESVSGEGAGTQFLVDKVIVDVQIDEAVTSSNRERLQTILSNHLKATGLRTEVNWSPVRLPQIGQSAAMEEVLRKQLKQRISQAIDQVIEMYCPEDCVLSQVSVEGQVVSPDEAVGLPQNELVRDKTGRSIFNIESVEVELSINEAMDEMMRVKIANVVKAKTRFASPVHLDIQAIPFPESFSSKKEKLQRASEDPYGLEKLRQTLKIFREMAGTKEIISKSSNTESSNDRLSATDSKVDSTHATMASNSSSSSNWSYYIIGAILLAAICAAIVIRFITANRDAKLMLQAAHDDRFSFMDGQGEKSEGKKQSSGMEQQPGAKALTPQELAMKLKADALKEELVQMFLNQPKVAQETFTRMLQEEGVEQIGKYVHIFGHMVVFELLDDPNLQRDLYALSEYLHKAQYEFTPEQEYQLLQSLKNKVTASNIRVLTHKAMDKFDFLTKLDATQIYNLVSDEKPQVQGIVLTQLDHKRRRSVFEMYQGDSKVQLMHELCRADAIPKEYLSNVARALAKKVQTRPEFDTQNLRSSDILFDLLEKSTLEEQRALMANLKATNAEAARGIKLKLVTVEILPYLKDGHLLELILGLEREDLLTFLAGTKDHIRNLLISKAPPELAESWIEDLSTLARIDEQNYRLVEMKVIGRIRNLANNGAFNLLDINEMLFQEETPKTAQATEKPVLRLSDRAMVA